MEKFQIAGILTREWPYVWGGIAFAIINTIIFLVNGDPWGITTSITYISSKITRFFGFDPAHWEYFLGNIRYDDFLQSWTNEYNLVIIVGFFIGAAASSVIAGEFSWKKINSKKQVAMALVGGFMIGYGARLASGCSVGALLGGISSFSLHGWIFATSAFIGVILGVNILIKNL